MNEYSGPYDPMNGRCGKEHPVNGFGRCEYLNRGLTPCGEGQPVGTPLSSSTTAVSVVGDSTAWKQEHVE